MAMALSSTMAPTVLSSQCRRRAPTHSANANSGPRREPESFDANISTDANEESETKGNMEESNARTNHTRGVRFAAFDAALSDSDQTITGGNVGVGFRASSSVVSGASWRWRSDANGPTPTTRVRSSFFPDSTDDEESVTLALRRSGVNTDQRRDKPSPTPTPTSTSMFEVIHIGDVQFPTTRTVLWNRRVLLGPFDLATADVLPRVRITNRVLKQLHALVVEKNTRGASHLLGYATTDETTAQGEGGCVTLSTLVHQQPDARGGRQPLWSVPFYRAKPVHPDDEATDRSQMERTIRAKYEATSGTSRSSPHSTSLPVEARGFVHTSRERSRAEIDIEIDVVVPCVQLQLSHIRALPPLLTPLAASLLRCEFGSEIRRFGFLTLDRARKAVPLLETDPLVLQRPIVGLWVYGIDVGDGNSADSVRVRHPYLLEACVRFLSSKIIKERAQVDVDTFLVAVYPGNIASPLPRFFECHAARTAQSQSPPVHVAWRSASARGRCLAGVASFKNDLELNLVLTPEEDSRSVPTSVDVKTPPNQSPQATLQRPVVAQDHSAEYETHRFAASSRLSERQDQPIESDSMKSCCRSQQILASQHQQMLEHQQRQLRDLQEQIAQLQRVLTETRAEKARLLSASSSRSSGSSHAEDDAHPEQEQELDDFDRRNDGSSASVPAPGLLEEDERQSQQDIHDRANNTSMVSSLALSAVSDVSNASELSSVSSSVVGTRLKTLLTTDQADENDTKDVEPSDPSKKQSGSPRKSQTVGEVDNQEASRTQNDEVADEDDGGASSEDEGLVRRACPYVPSTKRIGRRVQCERDEFDDESDASKIDELLTERLRIPVTPNREEIVRGGALPTFGFSHGSSFSIPKIKYVAEIVTSDSDDDEEEEIRRIELKYRKQRAH